MPQPRPPDRLGRSSAHHTGLDKMMEMQWYLSIGRLIAIIGIAIFIKTILTTVMVNNDTF